MSLPKASFSALPWKPYQGNYKNLIYQNVCDFTTYSSYNFAASGTVQSAPAIQTVAADGISIDNTSNANAVAVVVGNLFTENIPPYSKTLVQLGGTAPSVTITSAGGTCLATFYTGDFPGSLGQQNILGATQAAIGVYIQPGIVTLYAGLVGNIPTGYLLCDGSQVSRITYASLFGAIGTLYGAGDGASTFNLPDTRGKFVRGFDNGAGVDSGRVLGSSQSQNVGKHSHQLPLGFDNTGVYLDTDGTGSNTPLFGFTTVTNYCTRVVLSVAQAVISQIVAFTDSNPSAGGLPAQSGDTRPINVCMNYIIKT